MKILNCTHSFQWVGEGIPVQKRGKKICYKAFILGDLKVEIGDHVLVRNDDALDPEDFTSCYVAQIKNLFDTGDEFDPYQAQVQWFSRVLELPTYAIKLFQNAGHELEVVKDARSSWHDMIDAETIFQKCEVLFLSPDCNFESALSVQKNLSQLSTPVFFCRYVFTGTSLLEVNGQLKAIPTKISSTNGNSISNRLISQDEKMAVNSVTSIKDRFQSKACERFCAFSVGDPTKIPRVVIKRIDDRILESQNKNVRIFVANSDVENIEDVANIFLNKLKLEKQEDIEKKPILHALTSQHDLEKNVPAADNDFMDYDSHAETETLNNPQKVNNEKCALNFNADFRKKISSYNTRNSPKKNASEKCENVCTTPKKKPKITMLTDLRLKPASPKFENFANDNSKSRQEKNKHKNLENQFNIESSKMNKYKNDDPCEKNCHFFDDVKIDDLSLSFRTTKSFKNKETANPVHKSAKTGSFIEITKSENADAYSTPKKKKAFDVEKSSPNKSAKMENSDSYLTPKKKVKFPELNEEFHLTRSGRRVKAVNYTEENGRSLFSFVTPTKKVPRYVCSSYSDDDSDNYTAFSHSSDDDSLSDQSLQDEAALHKTTKKKKTVCKKSGDSLNTCTPKSRKSVINLTIPERRTPLRTPKNALEESRQRLHVSSVPSSLPCRDEEYSDIYSFVKGCLCAQTGGCMYISGVPGTGKTATVHEVMRNLEEEKELGEVPIFTFVEVNGMWMTDPYQCYVQIFKALTSKSIAPQQAADLLEKRFTERGPKKDAVVLLVDELDRLWTRKQTVMYNIFDWPTKKNSKLIVLAIANTMDLPERMMMNRISSRLGLTRKTFQPYTFKQLQEIIMSRIQELKVFDPDAVQLVARKVAAVSGDARRALDICRFATETVNIGQTSKKSQKILVGMEHVDKALQQMFSSPVISAIRSSSKIVKLFFQCILSEFTRSGLEETTLLKVHRQVISTCRFEGLNPPNSTEISRICADLAASHLILVDNFKNDLYMKIRLNISSDDVTYALTLK